MEARADINPWGCLHLIIYFLIMLILGFILALFGSCKSVQYVPVETVRHDSIYLTKWQKDSLYIHDSIFHKEKGDTILIEKWHTKYIEKQVHDTTYVSKVDSIQVPYPVVQELKRSEKAFITIGKIATGIGIGLIIFGIIWLIFWIRRKFGK